MALACIIAGVVGGLGETGVKIGEASANRKAALYQNEQLAGQQNMLAKAQVDLANKAQLTNMAASILQTAQAGQVAEKQAGASQTTKIVLFSIGGLAIVGIAAMLIIYKKRKAQA